MNTSSVAALAGLAYGAAYAASKGGVLAFTRALAVEYGKQGVRVNCGLPRLDQDADDRRRRRACRRTPT